jgi:tetratricopeptide (TPR) repeat protein
MQRLRRHGACISKPMAGVRKPYAHMGLLEARQERYKEAVPFYRKALALNPHFPVCA